MQSQVWPSASQCWCHGTGINTDSLLQPLSMPIPIRNGSRTGYRSNSGIHTAIRLFKTPSEYVLQTGRTSTRMPLSHATVDTIRSPTLTSKKTTRNITMNRSVLERGNFCSLSFNCLIGIHFGGWRCSVVVVGGAGTGSDRDTACPEGPASATCESSPLFVAIVILHETENQSHMIQAQGTHREFYSFPLRTSSPC